MSAVKFHEIIRPFGQFSLIENPKYHSRLGGGSVVKKLLHEDDVQVSKNFSILTQTLKRISNCFWRCKQNFKKKTESVFQKIFSKKHFLSK